MPKEVIIIEQTGLTKKDTMEVWGSLTAICKQYNQFKYAAIRTKDYPFIHEGYLFKKLKYNKSINKK